MENATKALEIAGGVLISLLVLGLLIYAYNNLSSVKQTEYQATQEQQSTDFNKQYEAYNKDGLYGSQIFSLANLINEYNKNESDKKGYQEISLSAKFPNTGEYIKGGLVENKNKHSLTEQYDSLEKAIVEASKTPIKCNDNITRTLKTLNSMDTRKLTEILGNDKEKRKILDAYISLIKEQTDVARLQFKTPDVAYYSNGRIKSMSFEVK